MHQKLMLEKDNHIRVQQVGLGLEFGIEEYLIVDATRGYIVFGHYVVDQV